MTIRLAASVTVVIGMTLGAGVRAASEAQTLTVPTFGTVTIYRPDTPPQQVVLFLSGDGGWNLGVIGMAERLRRAGALVVGIDIRAFVRSLESSKGCAYPAGALEELSRAVQLRFKLPRYQRPILVGYSSGATLVYAAIAAAPPETFAGAISLGFCPDIQIGTSLCAMRGLKATRSRRSSGDGGYDLAPFKESTVPWMVLQGETDQVCEAERHACVRGRDRRGTVVLVATRRAWLRSHPELGTPVCRGVSGHFNSTTGVSPTPLRHQTWPTSRS